MYCFFNFLHYGSEIFELNNLWKEKIQIKKFKMKWRVCFENNQLINIFFSPFFMNKNTVEFD